MINLRFVKSRDLKDWLFELLQGFGGVDGEDGVIYDEDIKAQMQNAIDDLLRLNGCDEIPPGHPLANAAGAIVAPAGASSTSPVNFDPTAVYPPLKNGEQFCNSSEMQVDLALNEAVNSIL